MPQPVDPAKEQLTDVASSSEPVQVSRDQALGWETRELSPDRWRDPEFDGYDLTVTGISPDGSWALVNYVSHELAGTFRESWPGAYDERISTATGVPFRFFGGYEGGEAFGLFLLDGNLRSRYPDRDGSGRPVDRIPPGRRAPGRSRCECDRIRAGDGVGRVG